jgi:hypothetical protein
VRAPLFVFFYEFLKISNLTATRKTSKRRDVARAKHLKQRENKKTGTKRTTTTTTTTATILIIKI